MLSWLPEGIKQDLGWDARSAALEELAQGRHRGYDAKGGGKINRGFWEGIRDSALGNSEAEIEQLARDLHVENINRELGDRINTTNQGLREIDAADRQIRPTYTDTVTGLSHKLDNFDTKIPVVATGQDANPDAGITIDTPIPQINRSTRSGNRIEENNALLNNPVYQNQLAQQNLTNQLALSQMSLSQQQQANQMQIAMMDNQLDRRRLDMQEDRLDRKDRQAMIQQLMAGLAQMGASIAI